MFDEAIAKKVLEVLNQNPDISFQIKDFITLAQVKKHHYKLLKDTLFHLARTKQVQRDGKAYRHAAGTMPPVESSAGRRDGDRETPNARLVEGRLDATPLARNHAFAFVITGDGDDVFVSEEDLGDALHNDLVQVELAFRRGRKRHGIIRRVIERNRTRFVGNIEEHRADLYFVPDDPKIVRNFLVRDAFGAHEGQKVLLEIVNWGSRPQHTPPTGDVVEVLGKAGDPQVEVLGVIRQYDLPLTFPDVVLAEADALPDDTSTQALHNRLDLRQSISFTIDPVSAKDFDDAIALERMDGGWKLYVHIADVAHWVRPGSALFREAENRGNSYYFPKMVLPMLPEKISNKLSSLRPQEDKLCLSVISELDASFRIRKQSVHETVIRSAARLTYEEVDALFAGGEHDIPPEVVEQLLALRTLSEAFNQRRRAKGCLWFDMPETEYEFDEQGYLTALGRSHETESHKLVENCMLVANEYVAGILTKKAPATLYRIHEDPVEEKVIEALEKIKRNGFKVYWMENISKTLQAILLDEGNRDFHRVFDPMLLRTMMKAKYSTEHKGHFGLAMTTYTHFTSPIRRLCDLVVHQQLKAHVLGSDTVQFTPGRLHEMADRASEQELLAAESEREVNRVNERHFMKQHIGEEFEALLTHISNAVIIYELDQYPVHAVIRTADLTDDHYRFLAETVRLVGRNTGRMFKLMDRARVRIERVEDEVYVSLVEQPREKPEIRRKKRERRQKKER